MVAQALCPVNRGPGRALLQEMGFSQKAGEKPTLSNTATASLLWR